ncbi:hypothetical protein ZEAMMB73_Zm00001d050248, partial [Zea mays]
SVVQPNKLTPGHQAHTALPPPSCVGAISLHPHLICTRIGFFFYYYCSALQRRGDDSAEEGRRLCSRGRPAALCSRGDRRLSAAEKGRRLLQQRRGDGGAIAAREEGWRLQELSLRSQNRKIKVNQKEPT